MESNRLGFVCLLSLTVAAASLRVVFVSAVGYFHPNDLFEAAFVDGCSYPCMFWQITLPLSRLLAILLSGAQGVWIRSR